MKASEKAAHIWQREELVRPVEFDRRRAIEIGAAGEHLVCADILLLGHRAFFAGQGCPYDLVVQIATDLIRVTVKSVSKPTPRAGRPTSRGCYTFTVTRSKRDNKGKTHARAYELADVDLVALVALDTRQVGYIALRDCPTTINLHADHGSPRANQDGPRFLGGNRRFEDLAFADALNRVMEARHGV